MEAGLAELEKLYQQTQDRAHGRNLAYVYVKHGYPEKVVGQVQENIKASRRDLEAGSLALADELAVSGLYLIENGDFEIAEPVLREVLLVRQEQIPNHWKTYNAQSMLGGALLGQGRLDEAEPLLIESCQGLEKIQCCRSRCWPKMRRESD